MSGLLVPRGQQGLRLFSPAAASSGVAPIDPATLPLTGWWTASFGGVPWTGETSLGTSGSHDLNEATNPPATGGLIGGSAAQASSFDGTNDQLLGDAMSSYFTATAYSYVLLLKITDAINTTGAAFTDDQVFTGASSFMGLACSVTGGLVKVQAYHYDGAYKETAKQSVGTDWVMVSVTYNGTTLSMDINESGSPSTIAAGSVGSIADSLQVAKRYDGAAFLGMDVGAILFADTVLDGPTRAGLKAYFNETFELSL